jgi:hypothetical protein
VCSLPTRHARTGCCTEWVGSPIAVTEVRALRCFCRESLGPAPFLARQASEPLSAAGCRARRTAPPTSKESITLSDETDQENARRPGVISSPDLGVFAVVAGGSGLRRGRVICSAVFAVADVAAAVALCRCPSFGALDCFG